MKNDDLPTRRIYGVALAIALFIVASALIVWAGGAVSAPVEGAGTAPPTFMEPGTSGAARYRAEQQLSSYGWTDRTRGRVHVPIDVAIDLALRGAR